ncbi:hypothetical protein [Alteribacter natronophilus]|uniref:hypothetical protein n=1 Tax=Alteribacter natronophilus TaxID=2583810 RepID=UPI00110F1E10|nr:hypothetical protein [Alteribacter natronophilus]TMW70744.1 hypothetical protein FGB90_16335 [Alteribacter natronophilus]
MNNHNIELSKSYKNISLLFFWVVFLLLVVVVFLNIVLGIFTWETLYMGIINSLISVMIPLVLFNILFDHFTKSYQNKEISDSITKALTFEKEVLEQFTPESKKQFIRSSTESLLGETEGNMLYQTVMAPYLNHVYNFRRNFRYHISYIENREWDCDFGAGEEAVTFSQDDYYLVEEELSFARTMNNYDVKKKRISAGFSYEESGLENLLGDEGFFFRENFLVDERHAEQLRTFSNETMTAFVKEFLRFSFEFNDCELDYDVINTDEGFYLKFHFGDVIEQIVGTEFKFRYKFRMPQLKSEKKFIAIVSEPTERVDILFTHSNNDARLTAIPFFDDSEAISYLPNNIVKIELDKWVMPRSGVVFTWDKPAAGSAVPLKNTRQAVPS